MWGRALSGVRRKREGTRRCWKMTTTKDAAVCLLIALWLAVLAPTAQGISCYKCSSRNGSDVNCEDPFHPAAGDYFKPSCMVPKEGHVGQFPANFCVKVIGTVYSTGERIVIRTCTLGTMDNQCGEFNFESQKMSGCILSCQGEGCNGANRAASGLLLALFGAIMATMAVLLFK